MSLPRAFAAVVLWAAICVVPEVSRADQPAGSAHESNGVQYVLVPSQPTFTAGAASAVDVYLMNEGTTPVTVVIPAIIPAAFVLGERDVSVQLVPDAVGRSVTIAPKSFETVRCRLVVPDDAQGRSILVGRRPEADPRSLEGSATASPADSTAGTATPVKIFGQTVAEAGLVEYRPLQFSAHEPIYFLIGADEPNGKFQFSFKYQIVPTDSPLGEKAPWTTGFHLAYTQLSFWDLEGESKPFFDNSYKPELLWIWDNIRPGDWGPVSRLDLQLGLQHESNGRDGDESRSVNIAYVRPVITLGDREGWFVSIGPRVWAYLGSQEDNDDIEQFRGYGDLKVVAGKGDGLQLSATGRIGSDFDKGSLQLDLSYPIRKALFDSIDIYLHGQLFTGFGESLLGYNDSDTNFRVGISLVR